MKKKGSLLITLIICSCAINLKAEPGSKYSKLDEHELKTVSCNTIRGIADLQMGKYKSLTLKLGTTLMGTENNKKRREFAETASVTLENTSQLATIYSAFCKP